MAMQTNTATLEIYRDCPYCDGTGYALIGQSRYVFCDACIGSGKICLDHATWDGDRWGIYNTAENERIAERERRSQISIARRNTQSSKMPIPSNIRWAVWQRDGFRCKYCGSQSYLTIDHVIPESKGGETIESNLQTLCRSCNARKGDRQ